MTSGNTVDKTCSDVSGNLSATTDAKHLQKTNAAWRDSAALTFKIYNYALYT